MEVKVKLKTNVSLTIACLVAAFIVHFLLVLFWGIHRGIVRELMVATITVLTLLIINSGDNLLSLWREMKTAKRDLQYWDLLRSDYNKTVLKADNFNK
jgi:hypothetical protein